MPWIHEHPDWPRFSWDATVLTPLLADVRHRQGLILGKMSRLGIGLKNEANLRTLTDDIVNSSAIEGEILEPVEVRSSIARHLGIEAGGLIAASRDVDGVVEMMLDATQAFETPLTVDRLFGWHASLFPSGRSGLRRIAVGRWRSKDAGPMQVISGPSGREHIHFEAPEADRIDSEMSAFIEWLESDRANDPVVKAGLAHLWFITIHPFEDGNGRIARAITDMMLARADGTSERYYSMSSQIESERKAYYVALETAQRSDVNVTSWLEWFLACLGRALDGAERTLEEVLYKAAFWDRANRFSLNDRQRKVLGRMMNDFQGHLKTSKYAKLAKCSNDTALRDIIELLSYGMLVQNPGGGRSTSYRLAVLEDPGQKNSPNS